MRKAFGGLAVALGLASSSAFAWHTVPYQAKDSYGNFYTAYARVPDAEDEGEHISGKLTPEEKAKFEAREYQKKLEEYKNRNRFVENGENYKREKVYSNLATGQAMYVNKKTGHVRFE